MLLLLEAGFLFMEEKFLFEEEELQLFLLFLVVLEVDLLVDEAVDRLFLVVVVVMQFCEEPRSKGCGCSWLNNTVSILWFIYSSRKWWWWWCSNNWPSTIKSEIFSKLCSPFLSLLHHPHSHVHGNS